MWKNCRIKPQDWVNIPELVAIVAVLQEAMPFSKTRLPSPLVPPEKLGPPHHSYANDAIMQEWLTFFARIPAGNALNFKDENVVTLQFFCHYRYFAVSFKILSFKFPDDYFAILSPRWLLVTLLFCYLIFFLHSKCTSFELKWIICFVFYFE